MKEPVRIAVVGTGLIGMRHAERIRACASTRLAAVVDPRPSARDVASRFGVPGYESLGALLDDARRRPDGVVLGTPNQMHLEGALECIAAGVPVLVEKPLADTVEGGRRIVEAGEAAGVPVLTGHHRRHSAVLRAAEEVVRSGSLGDVVAVTGTALFRKPEDYFEVGGGWRRQSGGGPVLINLVHEVNALAALVGDVVAVQAVTSNAQRHFAVEDTAGMVLTFAGGAVGTFLLSDAAASPRSWELTSGEDPAYPRCPQEDCYHVAGTLGSLSIPTMRLYRYPGAGSWLGPFTRSVVPTGQVDPLAAQIENFAGVVAGTAEPRVTGREGLTALKVVEAVLTSARLGRLVSVGGKESGAQVSVAPEGAVLELDDEPQEVAT